MITQYLLRRGCFAAALAFSKATYDDLAIPQSELDLRQVLFFV
jgi:hypothetical protein